MMTVVIHSVVKQGVALLESEKLVIGEWIPAVTDKRLIIRGVIPYKELEDNKFECYVDCYEMDPLWNALTQL